MSHINICFYWFFIFGCDIRYIATHYPSLTVNNSITMATIQSCRAKRIIFACVLRHHHYLIFDCRRRRLRFRRLPLCIRYHHFITFCCCYLSLSVFFRVLIGATANEFTWIRLKVNAKNNNVNATSRTAYKLIIIYDSSEIAIKTNQCGM